MTDEELTSQHALAETFFTNDGEDYNATPLIRLTESEDYETKGDDKVIAEVLSPYKEESATDEFFSQDTLVEETEMNYYGENNVQRYQLIRLAQQVLTLFGDQAVLICVRNNVLHVTFNERTHEIPLA